MRRLGLPFLFLLLGALGAAGIAAHFAVDRQNWASTDHAQIWAPTYEMVARETGRVTAWNDADPGHAVAAGDRLGEITGQAGVEVLRAPHLGRLAGDFAYVGALVQSGQELALVADLSRPYVIAYIGETQAAKLQAGETADVRFADEPGAVVRGTVAKVYPAVAQIIWPLPALSASTSYSKSTQWVPVRIDFPSGAAVPRYLGMSASVRIAIGGGGS